MSKIKTVGIGLDCELILLQHFVLSIKTIECPSAHVVILMRVCGVPVVRAHVHWHRCNEAPASTIRPAAMLHLQFRFPIY